MKFRKPVSIVLLAGITAVYGLVLALTQTSLYPLLAEYFEGEVTLEFAIIGLMVLMAIAMTALGYGIGVEESVRRAGTSRVLYRRHRRVAKTRRTEELGT